MISGSVGTGGYGYSINLDTFNKLSSFEIVDTILSNIEDKDLDEIEIFIKEVYNKSKDIKQETLKKLNSQTEQELALAILNLPTAINKSLDSKSMNEIAEYLYNITSLYNKFY